MILYCFLNETIDWLMINYSLSFLAVVRAGGFSKASQVVGVSKAQLSRHVSELEKALGIQLLHRTTRRLQLTESGKQFLASCEKIDETFSDAVNSVKQDFNALRGTLKISAPISMGSELLPSIIDKFTRQYPNIKIILSLSSVNVDVVEENYDLVLRVASSLPNSNLKMRPLLEFEQIICASPEYIKKYQAPKTPMDLSSHRCITSLNRDPAILNVQWPFYIKNKKTNITPNSVIAVDGLRAQVEMIAMGVGVGRAPEFFIKKELEEGKIIKLMPEVKQPKYYLYMLYPNRKILAKKNQLFMDLIKEEIKLINT